MGKDERELGLVASSVRCTVKKMRGMSINSTWRGSFRRSKRGADASCCNTQEHSLHLDSPLPFPLSKVLGQSDKTRLERERHRERNINSLASSRDRDPCVA